MRSFVIASLYGIGLLGCGPGSNSLDMALGSNGTTVDCEQLPAGSICLSISGESLSLGGYDYPPAVSTDAAFTDGWQIRFSKLLVTVDKIQLHANPDESASDQSLEGALVAEVDGPWAFDLHKGGPLTGKGGVGANDGLEEAYAFAAILNQNKNGNQALDPAATYAFGYSTVPATAAAHFVNVDAGDSDYAEMIAKGCTVYYVGTATWIGNSADNPDGGAGGCTSSNAGYDFSQIPQTVNYHFCYKSPTSYVNCQNPDQHGGGVGGEDSPRGIQVNTNDAYIAQITLHTDHPMWESVTENSPLHFDQFAANAVKQADGSYLATLENVIGKDWQGMTDARNNPLPWRSCLAGYTPPLGPQMILNGMGIPDNPKGDPTMALRDYDDYTTYVQSTQGHLNSNGLCHVSRNYPAPSGN